MPQGKPKKLRQASLFDAFPQPAASPAPKQKKKRKQRTPPPIAMPVYSSPTRNRRYMSPTRASTPEDDEVVGAIKFEASPGAGPSSRRQKTLVVDSDSDDLGGTPATSSQVTLDFSDSENVSRKRKRPARPSSSPSASPASAVVEISSESDEAPPAKKSKSKAKEKVAKKSKVVRGKQPARSSDEDEDDDDLPVPTPAKRRFVRGGRTSPMIEDEDDDSPPAEPRSGKRRLARGGRARKSSVEDDDLDDGEDSFMQEVDKEAIIDNRLRTRDKKTAFQKNLEKLKRRKQGNLDLPSSSDEEEGSDAQTSSEDDLDKSKPFKDARPAGESGDEDEDKNSEEDEDTFIVDDDDDQAVTELPPEFSMSTHQDMMHHFKNVFQLFCHVAVQEHADREAFMETQIEKEQYFSVPLQIVRRKIDSLRVVLVESSRFQPAFKELVSRYPHFELYKMDFAVNGCDACTMQSRISTIAGRLSGVPYIKNGFEPRPLKKGPDSDSDSDPDAESDSDSKATGKGSEQEHPREMHLGRICAKRVRILHEFSHWDHSLFQAIDDEVTRLKSSIIASSPTKKEKEKKKKKKADADTTSSSNALSSFVKVAHANGIQPPTDLSDADRICEWLDERGIIGFEWQRMKTMLKDAQELASGVYKRGNRDDDDVYS